MNYGFITICLLFGIGLLVDANKHGKERQPVNFWNTLLSSVIWMTLILWALHFNIN